jgi:hypothetical protein
LAAAVFSGLYASVPLATPRRPQPHPAKDHRQLRLVDSHPWLTLSGGHRLEGPLLEPLVPQREAVDKATSFL